jgi:hypothetical protein
MMATIAITTSSGPRRSHSVAAILALMLSAIAGCDAGPRPPATALLTLASLRAGFQAAPDNPLGVGLSSVFGGGFAPGYFLASKDEIKIASAFTDGQPSAYTTTDIWVNFPEVWAQPLYVFISTGGAAAPAEHQLDLPWIVSVGTGSAFWSPYFRVSYVEVPPDTSATRFRTVRDVLDSQLPVHPGPTRLLSLLPDAAMGMEDPAHVLLPSLRAPGKIGLPVARQVWVDGLTDQQTGLDFGSDRFETDADQAIVEAPLFFFFIQDAGGAWVPLTTIPRVGGTGPPYANRPPVAPGNRPLFGSFWRLWAARLPASARIFVPQARQTEWDARNWNTAAAVLPVAQHVAALDQVAGIDAYAFRVLLDDDCLATATTLQQLAQCPWLDSQAALERQIPAGLVPSEILVTCPYVAIADQPVPRPLP